MRPKCNKKVDDILDVLKVGLPVASGSEQDTADSHKLLNKILTKLDGLFSSKKTVRPFYCFRNEKDYTKINTLLNVEGVEDSDGKVTLTEEQVKAVNDRLDALETEVGEQKDLVRQRDEQIRTCKNPMVTLPPRV